MFTDSETIKSFQRSKTKCGYILNFRLAIYFRDLFLKEVKASAYFEVSFDEIMNKVNKVLQEE